MKKNSTQPSAHLFICTRHRDKKKSSCGGKGSEELVSDLKKWVKESGLKKSVKVSQSSCLGHCEQGIVACLYPKNQWFTDIELKDREKIQKLLTDYADKS